MIDEAANTLNNLAGNRLRHLNQPIFRGAAFHSLPEVGAAPVALSRSCPVANRPCSIDVALGQARSLGLFGGLNLVALVLVFLFVEETKRRSLEELDHIFAVSKRKFMRFQITERLPWLMRRYLFGAQYPPPELYQDLIWGPADAEELSSRLDVMSHRGRQQSQDQVSLAVTNNEGNGARRGPHVVEIDDGYPRYPSPRVPFATDWPSSALEATGRSGSQSGGYRRPSAV